MRYEFRVYGSSASEMLAAAHAEASRFFGIDYEITAINAVSVVSAHTADVLRCEADVMAVSKDRGSK